MLSIRRHRFWESLASPSLQFDSNPVKRARSSKIKPTCEMSDVFEGCSPTCFTSWLEIDSTKTAITNKIKIVLFMMIKFWTQNTKYKCLFSLQRNTAYDGLVHRYYFRKIRLQFPLESRAYPLLHKVGELITLSGLSASGSSIDLLFCVSSSNEVLIDAHKAIKSIAKTIFIINCKSI